MFFRATWADGRTLLFSSPSMKTARQAMETLPGEVVSIKEVKK